MANLVIETGLHAGDSHELGMRETTIGREPTCEVCLPSRTVSRRHARVILDQGNWFIEDLGSVNGTDVNGRRINKRTRLVDQDRIRIFDITLVFVETLSDDLLAAKPEEDSTVVKKKLVEARRRVEELEDQVASKSPPIVTSFDARRGAQRTNTNAEAKLNAMMEITHHLGNSLDIETLLPRILEGVVGIFPQANRGYILQEGETADELTAKAIYDEGDTADTISPIGGEMAARVMEEKAAFLSSDAVNDARLDQIASSIFEERIRSFVCAPLMGPSQTPLGVIHIETNNPEQPFSQPDLDVLVSVALLAGQAVEYAQAHRAEKELDQRRTEMAMAKKVQLHFLPSEAPKTNNYHYFNFYRAADEMAGDYYDYVKLPNGKVAVAQGDVAGKGTAAALLMARLCSDLRYALLTEPNVLAAVKRLNNQMERRGIEEGFVTLVVAVVDPAEDSVTIVNAGHMNPLIWSASRGRVEELTTSQKGLPLGVLRDCRYTEDVIQMHPGDTIVMYTDGVSDAMDPQGKLFGVDGICKVIDRGLNGAQQLGNSLVNEVRQHAAGRLQNDDICIVCLERSE